MYWISSIKNMNSPRSFKMRKLIVWPQTWKFWFYGVEVRIYAEPAQCICVLCVILNSLDWIHYKGCQLWMVVLLKLTTTKIPVKVHIFWEGHKILGNLHLTFDWHYIGEKQNFVAFIRWFHEYFDTTKLNVVIYIHSVKESTKKIQLY